MIKIIKSRRMRWVGHVAYTIQKRNADKALVPEGKRSLGRRRIYMEMENI
jgi:hypothetical protein